LSTSDATWMRLIVFLRQPVMLPNT